MTIRGQAGSGTAHLVKQVYDQYIDFVSLERDLFSMNMDASYMAFNDPQVTPVRRSPLIVFHHVSGTT